MIRSAKPALWLLLFAFVYAMGHMLWYWQTPLGQNPTLDGQENLILSEQIANGTLAKEPFYRAMLYPALLALLPIHWMVLGILCHLTNTLLSMALSRRIWKNAYAPLISGALVGFNPVLLHFAFDPLDATLAIMLFLSGFYLLSISGDRSQVSLAKVIAGGFLVTLAALARPHFFTVLLPLCGLSFAAAFLLKRYRIAALTLLATCLSSLAIYGAIQKAHGGAFAIMPTQGGFNLWKSNYSQANGLYLQQSLNFHYDGEHKNPSRMESEILFQRETGRSGTQAEQSAYWKSKTLKYITENPLPWLKLMSFKAYAWIHNFEQYNNKTYSFHKELSPWLRYNPIGWGLIIAAAAVAVTLASKSANRALLIAATLAIALYSSGALLYMASARFRLPLVPLIALIAGGLPLVATRWRSLATSRRIQGLGFAGAIAFLVFFPVESLTSKSTYQQDAMLLADAASRAGQDGKAFFWAEETLSLNPDRQDAKRLRLLTYYNLVATGNEASTGKLWSDFEADLDTITLDDPYIDFVRGVAYWNLKDIPSATETWSQSFEKHGWNASSSLAALLRTNTAVPHPLPRFQASALPPNALLVYTLNQANRQSLRETMGFNFPQSQEFYHSIGQSLNRVLPIDPKKR